MSCAVVLRYRLVAPHLHSILSSSLCIITSLYICLGNLPCSPASCKFLLLTFFPWESWVPIPLLCHFLSCVVHGSGAPEPGGSPARAQTSSVGLQCGPHSPSSARKEPGRDPAHPQLCLDREKAQGQRDTELAPVWYPYTEGWHGHLEMCGEQSYWMAMANINLCCFTAARVLLIFYYKGCDDVRG